MPEICPRYAQDMPEICQRYAQEMTTRKTVLTKRLPDKTSKPVRLKKMSHKSVLTKRLPDKTSKAVLTKCLPDKTSADPLITLHFCQNHIWIIINIVSLIVAIWSRSEWHKIPSFWSKTDQWRRFMSEVLINSRWHWNFPCFLPIGDAICCKRQPIACFFAASTMLIFVMMIFQGKGKDKKHCQRHNGSEGWVHITSSNTNLDQI